MNQENTLQMVSSSYVEYEEMIIVNINKINVIKIKSSYIGERF